MTEAKTGDKIVSVVVVNHSEDVRIRIRAGLESRSRIVVVAEGSGESDAIRLAAKYRPDVLLFGIAGDDGERRIVPRVISALDTIKHLIRISGSRVLVLSPHDHMALARKLLDAGAVGFVRQDETLDAIDKLVKVVLALAGWERSAMSLPASEKIQPYGVAIDDVPSMTDRRVEILQTIIDTPRLSPSQQAELLGIAEPTLRNNLSIIFRALGVSNLLGAVIEALRLGFVKINR